MIYRNFRLNCIFRIILIVINIFAFFFVVFRLTFNITPIILLFLIIVQTILLIRYIEKTNFYLTNFLEAIRFSEFTGTFQISGLGKSYDELKKSFANVMSDFQKIRVEKEQQQHYLKNVIQHIGIGLVAYGKNGKVEMINNAAKKLFRIYNLKNIQNLKEFSSDLTEKLMNIKPGEKALLKIQDEEDLLQLSLNSTEFKIGVNSITLVSIQNIQSEMEKQEFEAWQKLIRVLTHEIMNSITPIASLSDTIENMLDSVNLEHQNEETDETLEDIKSAIKTIGRRSDGLVHFVQSYRNLTKIPTPNYEILPLQKLFGNIKNLLEKQLEEKKITFITNISPKSLELTADENLIEQILINLLKNAAEALKDTKDAQIELYATLGDRGKVLISVKDNGQGILPDVLDKVFIPFFTTKQTGSGIGLSLSKQMMRLHGGTISCVSKPDVETIFTLKF
ncbi:MAG: HAMP domain-containing histidine kinase [Candidatus Cloacimonetes bacterium]|nr:HAMP domain-containing histidine kinase [Candidatus Cloacimonadota bacterium]